MERSPGSRPAAAGQRPLQRSSGERQVARRRHRDGCASSLNVFLCPNLLSLLLGHPCPCTRWGEFQYVCLSLTLPLCSLFLVSWLTVWNWMRRRVPVENQRMAPKLCCYTLLTAGLAASGFTWFCQTPLRQYKPWQLGIVFWRNYSKSIF